MSCVGHVYMMIVCERKTKLCYCLETSEAGAERTKKFVEETFQKRLKIKFIDCNLFQKPLI